MLEHLWIYAQEWSSWLLNFLRNCQTDFQSVCTSLQSHQQWRSVPLSRHPCPHILSPEVFYLSHWSKVWDRISRLFWFAFPWWLRMLNISSGASHPCSIPQLRILCLALYHIFKIWLFVSQESNFLSSLYILDISPLSDVGCRIFFQFVGCCFVLLTVSFALQKLCNFMRA